ncbi:MAG TPA: alpha/beta fold hydrolase [Paucimonas sp.]|nr:alpha/beta fold hydrolase [Paucimonas sp.]
MTKKKAALIVAFALMLFIGAPPLWKTLRQGEPPRAFTGLSLKELSYREVGFKNDAQSIALAGMLFVPKVEGPYPGVVIIHGSGNSHRDNFWYLSLVQHLQAQGIAVLLPDKRGSGKSEGNWRGASMEDLATDTEAAVHFLKFSSGLPLSKIGVIGLSQGGQIAPIVAARGSDVGFVTNVVGASLPLRDIVVYEERHNLRQLGFLPPVADAMAQLNALYLRHVGQRGFWQAVGDFDPLPYWRQVRVPALVVLGGEDTNVPTAASVERLRSLKQDNIKLVVYPDSGHALEDPRGRGDRIFRAEALHAISGFVHQAAR